LELLKEKLSLLKLRLKYLEESKSAQFQENISECEDEEENYSKYANITKKHSDIEMSKFEMNTVKTNLNSLVLQNNAFLERTIIYPENDTLTFVKYDFMHIRMKPQSTKSYKVPATVNSIPKYVLVVLYSNNILKIYDSAKKP